MSEHNGFFIPSLIGGHGFPSTWKYMLPPGFAQLALPAETAADCANCPPVASGEYMASCRCCTHFAQIPGFQLGLALKDEGARQVTQSILDGGYALPTGLEITPAHMKFTVTAHQDGLFGNSEKLLCPFMDRATGQCPIYAYRTVVCSTFYCAHDHGEEGSDFWDLLGDFVQQVEMAVTQWAMLKVGFDVFAYMARRNELADRVHSLHGVPDNSWSEETRRFLWAEWFGREETFFHACAGQVMGEQENLWDIARSVPILESPAYDSAVDAMLGADALDDGGDPITVDDLWEEVQLAAQELKEG